MIVVGGLGKTSWVSDGGAEQDRHHGSLDCSRGTGSDIFVLMKVVWGAGSRTTRHYWSLSGSKELGTT